MSWVIRPQNDIDYTLGVVLVPDVIHDDDELRIVTWSVVIASRWKATPTKEKIELVGRHQRALAQATVGNRIVMLNVLAPDTGALLSTAAREAAAGLAKDGREHLMGAAHVVEGQGFGAAAARAVMSGIQLAVRARYPTKVFGSTSEALPWVAELLRQAGLDRDADDVVEALRDVTSKNR